MSQTFNTFDLIFIGTSIIFLVTAFLRGIVKEIFFLMTWIIAFLISYFVTPLVSDLLSGQVSNKIMLDVTTRTTLFLVTFFVFIYVTDKPMENIKKKMPILLDRSLGIFFAIGKILLIFGVVYSVIANLYMISLGNKLDADGKKVPDWLSDAKCGNIVRISGEIIDPAVKAFIDAIWKNFSKSNLLPKTLDNKIDEVINSDQVNLPSAQDSKDFLQNDQLKNKNDKSQTDSSSTKETGYNKKDIEKMNRLIDVIDKVN
ncbi:MAG: CvpA family protein [Rickettsiales bacterium]|nr:CvpA family protein [Rickettsiales bacterium]